MSEDLTHLKNLNNTFKEVFRYTSLVCDTIELLCITATILYMIYLYLQ